MTTKKLKPKSVKQKRELTLQERTAINKFLARNAAKPAPRFKKEKGAGISLDHPNDLAGQALLMDALGTADLDFYRGLINQVASAGSRGDQIDEQSLNFMLSVVKGIEPEDQVVAMLAAQMAAVHMATMTFARRLAQVENIPQQDSAERAFNKLARTFTAQLEALKRYRTGGEQKVTVQHVSVGEGGQAIVGNVTQAPRETAPEKAAKSLPALTEGQQTPMTIIGEPEAAPTPVRRSRKDDK
jgi:hypothetical protein